MNKILLAGILLMLQTVIGQAADVSPDALQGSWRVVSVNGVQTKDEDYWEFEDDRFAQNLHGVRLSAEPITSRGNVIYTESARIEVLELDGKTLKAEMNGYDYLLEKK